MQDLFKGLGIIHYRTCVHTPQQNGTVERKHRYLLEVARALRFQGHIPIKFWGHCVLTAAYIINRLPSQTLEGKSPYEAFFGKKPCITHLRTFGCLCFASTLPRIDKFAPRAVRSVFMGYSSVTKGYVCFDLQKQKFFLNRDVIFHEDQFPFQSHSPAPKSCPMSSSCPIDDLETSHDSSPQCIQQQNHYIHHHLHLLFLMLCLSEDPQGLLNNLYGYLNMFLSHQQIMFCIL